MLKFYPHRREDYITKVAPVIYDPKATCPQFREFLSQTFHGSTPLIDYMLRLAGYFLTGYTTEQKWWMFYGPTASGKSTIIKILHGVMGDYAPALPENYFLLSKNDNTDFVTANLCGVRLATCVETNEGKRLNVARIKALTGEDMISACLKHQNYFQFKPKCKLVLVTNYPPHVPSGDDALWRRLKVVPFTAMVPQDKQVPGLADKLVKKESPGILNAFLAGLEEWQAHGLQEPKEVADAVAQYRTSEDICADCLAECFLQDPEAKALRKDCLKVANAWCKDNSYRPFNGKKFAIELSRLGIKGDDGNRFWLGIRPKDAFE